MLKCPVIYILTQIRPMQLQQIIENHWYKKINWHLGILLLPLSLIFFCLSKTRYYLYKLAIYKSYKLPIPVVIIGNISVGGVGKTPLTKMLALQLQNYGIEVGIILRGYKSKNSNSTIVKENANSLQVGDEALIYAQSGLKVAIGPNRYLTAQTLLQKYPTIQIILSDDGLQHYRLKRDFEIAVVDSNRLFGNRFVLPMGPLRETVSRLDQVNAIVLNGRTLESKTLNKYKDKLYYQKIALDKIYNPVSTQTVTPDYFADKKVTVMAAMGNPQRFVQLLNTLSITIDKTKFFPDHYHYQINDIPNDDVILVTEKDYTKLKQFNNPHIWVVMVNAILDNNKLLENIKKLVSRGN